MFSALSEGEAGAALRPALAAAEDPVLRGLHLGADVALAVAHVALPLMLLLFLLRRRDIAHAWLIGLLGVFVLAGGVIHLQGMWMGVDAAPGVAILVKVVSAALSLGIAALLWPRLPRLFVLRPAAVVRRELEERRAAEKRARASEARAHQSGARMAAFVANLPDALFVLRIAPGGALLIETLNPAFERMFGARAALLHGRPAQDLMPPLLVALSLPYWQQAAARGETVEYELTGDLPGGRRCWQTVLVPMRGLDGRVERLLGSARDVTATRRLQASLVQTARLATVGTMCAGLAHEASQPLNVAALWLRRVRAAGRSLPADQQVPLARAVAVVEEQLRRAGDLVTRMRALAGDEGCVTEPFDAVQAVSAALRIASAQYVADGVTLLLDGEWGDATVCGSPARLEQAVLHLLMNARDAVLERRQLEPDAPARIVVAMCHDPGRIAIEVRDTGHGIAEAAREAIFDPFFTTKEPGRGTGLGLPFAAGVARDMGGGLEAWNLPEGGACFRLELAVAAQAPAPRPRVAVLA